MLYLRAGKKPNILAAIGFYIALPFMYLVSLLPFRILYLLSDLFYLVIYKMLGYRKQVVLQNLRNSFPDKTEQELNKLASAYYHHLCDTSLETVKMLTASISSIQKRCVASKETTELLHRLYNDKQSAILVSGHHCNWEWIITSFAPRCSQEVYGIYHPLSNKYFDGLMKHIRSRYGTHMVPMSSAYKHMVRNRHKVSLTAFISDQSPPSANAHWMTFLNQETPVFRGAEVIAKKLNYPVLYISSRKKKRGHYHIHVTELFDKPKDTTDGAITEQHTRMLEMDIIAQPEVWMWSHRRWKHKPVN